MHRSFDSVPAFRADIPEAAGRLPKTMATITRAFGRIMPRGAILRDPLAEHRSWCKDAGFRTSVLQGAFLLMGSLVVNYLAGTYASLHAGHPVRDILLDRMPTLPVDIIFVDGALALWAFVLATLLSVPRAIPFVLKTLALFIVIRSFFVILTHIGPPADAAVLDPSRIMSDLTFEGDLFFSGHTGFPFLLALTFWENRMLRQLFLASSAVFALAVLFGHLHYSIDVFAAFFITDSIFRIAQRMFAHDYAMLTGRIWPRWVSVTPELSPRPREVRTDAHRRLLR
jgi:PAP2 superfamily C-terminal